jgi:murein DD-endopeptidase MepM/ murein hydrolase activator NlpD
LAAFAGLLAGCAQAPTPAPIVGAVPQQTTITIKRGQTLSGIAQTYRVPMRELAAANHLTPPYRILAGGVLLIPVAGPLPPAQTIGGEATAPTAVGPAPVTGGATPVTVAALPPRAPPPSPTSGWSGAGLAPTPADVPQPARPAASPPEPAAPRPAGPTEANTAATPAGASAVPTRPAAPSESAATPMPAHGSEGFLWPVHGRIIEGFGTGAEGTRNDGINIAAPRGAPVQAVAAGTVAYTGNELRGYGNLVLIKHPDGWISAYAHCEVILVKRGQRVARGQVIARVGSTGNVGTPQLHFELRHGDKAIDPRAHLAPLPNAGVIPARSG